MKGTKTTHIDTVRDMAHQQMAQVCSYFGWTEEQYNKHQLDEYEAFLNRRFHGREVSVLNSVRYSPIMAGFWKNEWRLRNEIGFLPFAADMCTETMHVNELGHFIHYTPSTADYATVYDEYCWLHSHRRLFNSRDFMGAMNYTIDLILTK